MFRLFIAVVTACVTFAPSLFAGENWPQFRGPDGQGFSDSGGVPVTWSEKENIKWKTPIHGKGWSSPVIWGKQIWFTTATEDAHQLFVVCVDKETGKIIRDQKIFDVPKPQFIIPFNSPASPTPTIEEGRVYITFGSPGTACIDTSTGKVLWERRDLECNHFRGAGSSPILHENMLIMNFDGSDFQYVVALDKNTGKTIWKTDRSIDFQDLNAEGKPKDSGDWRKAFSTPKVAVFGRTPILVSPGSKACYAYDPYTGREIWRTEERKFYSAAVRPVVGNGLIYVGNGQNKADLWAIKPGGHGVLTQTNIAWKYSKNVPGKPSFLVLGDLLFMVSDGGIATCLDAKTGDLVWEQTIGGHFSASPLYADGHIYFFSEEGKTTVIKSSTRKFKQVAENQLDAGFMASAAVSGKAFFLRTKTSLYRVER